MRESRTSGSVRGLGRESLVYSTAEMRTDLDLRGTYEKSNERTYG